MFETTSSIVLDSVNAPFLLSFKCWFKKFYLTYLKSWTCISFRNSMWLLSFWMYLEIRITLFMKNYVSQIPQYIHTDNSYIQQKKMYFPHLPQKKNQHKRKKEITLWALPPRTNVVRSDSFFAILWYHALGGFKVFPESSTGLRVFIIQILDVFPGRLHVHSDILSST